MMKRWPVACLVCFAAIVWLVWAFPRFHSATRLGLQFDRDGYAAQAQKIARDERVDVTGWRSFIRAQTQATHQELRIAMPADDVARAFPPASVVTNFFPSGGKTGAKLTLRADGRPLSWRLPVPAAATASNNEVAAAALRRMVGGNTAGYVLTSDAVSGSDGVTWKWTRAERSAESPGLSIETSVKNGAAWKASTKFILPENFEKHSDSFPMISVVFSGAWFVLLLMGIVVIILREGGGPAARAMKDRSVIILSCVAGLGFTVINLIEGDEDMIESFSGEILGLVLGTVILQLCVYLMSTATVLSARSHAGRVRGFRLLGTRAFFSRTVGSELLGGWLLAPVMVSVPLLVGAALRKPAFGGYEDGVILSRLPVLDGLLNAMVTQQTVALIGFLGVLVPLAIRFAKYGWMRYTLFAIFGLVTFSVIETPFKLAHEANLACAALHGLIVVWLYSQFGMLGALSAYGSARLLTFAGVAMVQPSASLHASGWGMIAAFAGFGLACLVAALKGPDVVSELYGESGARMDSRSRREELLAEFNVARSAQQQMLPAEPPVLEGYSIAASCQPAREVGGDLYDFLPLSDGRWGIGVADVSGKGVPAALYMTLTKGLLCAATQDSGDPRQILGSVNKHLKTVTKRKMFVTMALGVLDPVARRMEYVRAGHNPVVWRRLAARETRLLAGPGIGLGIAGPALFARTLATETLDLAPGDALVFYSDGLTEAMNGELEQFGEERLMAAVESADGMHATATRDSILKEVKRFLEGAHAQDDLTITVVRVNADTEIDGR